MIVHASTLGREETLEVDVCIAGAGPAGLTTALELGGAGVDVAVLERGGEPLSGEVEGRYPPLESTHAGGVGGTAAVWEAEIAPDRYGARYAPLASVDFSQREADEWGGWPFGRSDLDPWYVRAHEICDAGPYLYDPNLVAPVADDLLAGIFRFGDAAVFTRLHRDALADSARVRVIESATALALEGEGDVGTHLTAAVAPGRTFGVRARTFVLALGGVENARFLLLGRRANAHDLVGRFFMDHPTAHCRLEDLGAAADALGVYDTQDVDGSLVVATATLPEETIASEGLLNGGFFFVPAFDREARALAAVGGLAQAARARRLPENLVREVRNLVAGLDAVAVDAHRRLVRQVTVLRHTRRLSRRMRLLNTLGVGATSGWSRLRSKPRAFDVHHVIEQAPVPERRVTLAEARDEFGRPLPRLRYFVSDRELASLDRSEKLVAAALASSGVGRLRTARELAPGGDVRSAIHPSAHHQLGTTRMHVDPRRGVVDPAGRVHGFRNLYVVGGSVFPTCGYVNPTLTIVALAARLAAHLRDEALR